MSDLIRAVIAGRDADAIAATLATEQDIEVVAHCVDARAALAAVVLHAPDLLVVGEAPDSLSPEALVTVAERNHPHLRVLHPAPEKVTSIAETIRALMR